MNIINLDIRETAAEWEEMAREILCECTGRMHAHRTVDAVAASTLYALLAQHAPTAYSLAYQKHLDPAKLRVTVTLWHVSTHGDAPRRLLRGSSFAIEWTTEAH